MKQTIKLNESQLKDVIQESIKSLLSESNLEEGNFFNNVQGAIQGAYSGYKARQGANNARDNRARIASSGGNMSQRGAAINQMATSANELYEKTGYLAQLIRQGMANNSKMITGILGQIKVIVNRMENSMQQYMPQTQPDNF